MGILPEILDIASLGALDDADELLGEAIVSHQFPKCFMIDTVKCFVKINENDID